MKKKKDERSMMMKEEDRSSRGREAGTREKMMRSKMCLSEYYGRYSEVVL